MLLRRAITLGLMGLVLLSACAREPQTVAVTRLETEMQEIIVTQVVTRVADGESVEVVVTEIVQVEVTSTAAPIPQGGTIITTGDVNPATMNPILASSGGYFAWMFLDLLATDPFTGALIPMVAESWDVSADGLTYTFFLREDIQWSDGTPLTAHDVVFTWNAITTPELQSHRLSSFATVGNWQAVDDYTIEVELASLDCTALRNLALPVIPAHVYEDDPLNVIDSPENEVPSVVSGPFTFGEMNRDEFIRMDRNENYYDGPVNVDSWIVRHVDDPSANIAAFLAGETDFTGVPAEFVSTIETAKAAGEPFTTFKYVDDGFTYLAFNNADPSNPQSGWLDENENGLYDEGEAIQDQAPHPILSQKEVRQAISLSLNYADIINKVVFGQGFPLAANTIPAISWAYNTDLEPYAFDPDSAAELLENAGWIDTDGDGIRSKDGQTLTLEIMTNSGNDIRENIALILEENLEAIGFEIDLAILDFGTVVDNLLGQTFDAVIIGWTGIGSDPDDRWALSFQNDIVGSGLNFVSFYNEQFEANLQAGISVPGCREVERAPFYLENQTIFHEEAVYAPLFVPLGTVVYRDRIQGIDPAPWDFAWNVNDWYLTD